MAEKNLDNQTELIKTLKKELSVTRGKLTRAKNRTTVLDQRIENLRASNERVYKKTIEYRDRVGDQNAELAKRNVKISELVAENHDIEKANTVLVDEIEKSKIRFKKFIISTRSLALNLKQQLELVQEVDKSQAEFVIDSVITKVKRFRKYLKLNLEKSDETLFPNE